MSSGALVYVDRPEGPVLAGRLYSHRRRASESASFVYDESYLAAPEAYALDPALPLVRGTLQTALGLPLFAAFGDTAPDRWGRTLIQRRERLRAKEGNQTPRTLGELDLMMGVRDDLRQGALRFRSSPLGPFVATEEQGVPALIDLPKLLNLADRVQLDKASYRELTTMLHAGSSLGGARPKAHVMNADGSLAIAKFPSAASDIWNVMTWEKVALDLAADAAINVPRSTLLRIGGRSVLVVERFDRHGRARIGYVSAMTMLEARDGDQRSYLEIAEVVEQHSASATVELEQLWRRMVFSVLISNTDNHLRNHGFLHVRGDVWTMSPAFDLNPNPDAGPKMHSTVISPHDPTVTVEAALDVAGDFRLDDVAARRVLGEVSAVTSRWRELAGRHALSAKEIDAMEPAFEHTAADQARSAAP